MTSPAAVALPGCAMGSRPRGNVVVVGGGYGGATAAKYLRMWSQKGVDVTLVERNPQFISCPISNLVIGGDKQMADITMSYAGLRDTWGVKVVQDSVIAVDAAARKLRLASGGELGYDRLVLSPGVDFMFEQLPGLESEASRSRVLHAWKAGAQTVALRKQLEDMPDGGVYALTIPRAPYRLPGRTRRRRHRSCMWPTGSSCASRPTTSPRTRPAIPSCTSGHSRWRSSSIWRGRFCSWA